VGIPPGSYVVEVSLDTGPLAGLLKDSIEISFDGEKVSP
jgi:hypothetical protein